MEPGGGGTSGLYAVTVYSTNVPSERVLFNLAQEDDGKFGHLFARLLRREFNVIAILGVEGVSFCDLSGHFWAWDSMK